MDIENSTKTGKPQNGACILKDLVDVLGMKQFSCGDVCSSNYTNIIIKYYLLYVLAQLVQVQKQTSEYLRLLLT